MDKILKENDIVTLDDNVKYLVIKCIVFNGENYVSLCKLNSDINNIAPFIVREVIENDELYLNVLTDEGEIAPILEEFKKQINK